MVKRYIKPSWFFAKVFNRFALATGAMNGQPLTVIKRGSKLPQMIPITPVDVDDVKYLVAVRGETEWVKNVRANRHVKLTKSKPTDYVANEIQAEARKPILQAYKATAQQGDREIVSAATRRRRPPGVRAHAHLTRSRAPRDRAPKGSTLTPTSTPQMPLDGEWRTTCCS